MTIRGRGGSCSYWRVSPAAASTAASELELELELGCDRPEQSERERAAPSSDGEHVEKDKAEAEAEADGTTAADDDDLECGGDDGSATATLRSYSTSLRWTDPYNFLFDNDDGASFDAASVIATFDFDRTVPGRKCLTGSPDLAVMNLRDISWRCPCCIPCILPFLLREYWRARTDRLRGRKLADCRHLAASVEGILYVEDAQTLRGTPYSPRRVFVPFRSMVGVSHIAGESGNVSIYYCDKGGETSQRRCLWIERLQKPRDVIELIGLSFGDDVTVRHGEGYTIVFRRSRTSMAAKEEMEGGTVSGHDWPSLT